MNGLHTNAPIYKLVFILSVNRVTDNTSYVWLWHPRTNLPSSATGSTWFSFSMTVKETFPSHKTAASIANALSWSSFVTWTTSKASWNDARKQQEQSPSAYKHKPIWKLFLNKGKKNYHNITKLFSIINTSNGVIALPQVFVVPNTLQIQFLCVKKKRMVYIISITKRS